MALGETEYGRTIRGLFWHGFKAAAVKGSPATLYRMQIEHANVLSSAAAEQPADSLPLTVHLNQFERAFIKIST